jgi:hypothetical protein
MPFMLPDMPDLPSCRVASNEAFKHTGVDYFGPMYVKSTRGKPDLKVWVCLFTCMTIRAVHLEPVTAMSSEQFVYALRRFIARMGKPKSMLSDNAPTFKLISSLVEAKRYMSNQGIYWRFITEAAPWMGGAYERMVSNVKSSIKRSVGRSKLSYDQLVTLLCEAQDVVNSRPLTYVGSDVEEIAITPNHLLRGYNREALQLVDDDADDPTYVEREKHANRILSMWKKGQRLLNSFWKIWKTEYLTSLRERMRWSHKQKRGSMSRLPVVGEVVLIDGSPKARSTWSLGRVVERIQSHDGEVRSVKLSIPSGRVISRPLSLVYPLEVDPRCEEQDSCEAKGHTAEERGEGDTGSNFESVPSARRAAAGINATLFPTAGDYNDRIQHGKPAAGVNTTFPSADSQTVRIQNGQPAAGVNATPPLPPADQDPAGKHTKIKVNNEEEGKDTNTKPLHSNNTNETHVHLVAKNMKQCRSTQMSQANRPPRSKEQRPVREAATKAREAWLKIQEDSSDDDEEF